MYGKTQKGGNNAQEVKEIQAVKEEAGQDEASLSQSGRREATQSVRRPQRLDIVCESVPLHSQSERKNAALLPSESSSALADSAKKGQ